MCGLLQQRNQRRMAIPPFLLVIANLLLFSLIVSSETETITQSQPLHDDGTTLVSQGGAFELGFFSPGSSTNRYVGIWYKQIPNRTVVWVANRDNPIRDNSISSKLSISKEGNLELLSKSGTVHWSSTNATTKGVGAAVANLLDTGNLVLRDNDSESYYLWQSFDHPTDTLLPGMKLRWNQTSGLHTPLTSWKNWDDPSSGDFTFGVKPGVNPGVALWNGFSMIYESGPWNGVRFSDVPAPKRHLEFHIDFIHSNDEYYYTYSPRNSSLVTRLVINQTIHLLQRFKWDEGNHKWNLSLAWPRNTCDNYNICGSFGNCDINGSPVCGCLSGFEPKSPQNWIAKDWSQGCERSETWSCKDKKKDGFIRFSNLKVPDTANSWVNRNMTLEECRARCWENCSCTAFANLEISEGGIGCMMWFGDLMDLRHLQDRGQDLYVRLAASKIEGSKRMVALITSSISLIIVALLVFTFIYWRTKSKFREETEIIRTKLLKKESKQEDMELPLFALDTIARATNDFSNDNKLGEGGFGPVYKGTLPDGQDVAIKRLSRRSTQGYKEFKNEVIFCSKLQHRNLVRVLGCCVEKNEKLLIYEYMPNKSLDFFLFDTSQSKLLDWSMRFNIICGIARGLLYLHQDSRLRIIHRDLKANNILLDNNMNPKISDFGLARICDSNQHEGNTSKVVGTYGYMAPEYAIDGIFSIKSDIFSFGILLLEIISGKRNRELSNSNRHYNLLKHAWRLWKETKCIPMEFIDTRLGDSYISSEAFRCIHIGLLCTQHHPNDRPNMTSVIVMLTSESTLPQPKEPLFLVEQGSSIEEESSSGQQTWHSTADVTTSVLEPR